MAATMVVMFDFGGSDGSPGTEQNISGLGPILLIQFLFPLLEQTIVIGNMCI